LPIKHFGVGTGLAHEVSRYVVVVVTSVFSVERGIPLGGCTTV
jgi:hypothetical protein